MSIFCFLRVGDQYRDVVWFYIFYSERPKYAREMHGIIHSLTGGKLTFLSVCNYHSSWIFTCQKQKTCLCLVSELSEMVGGGIIFVWRGRLSAYDTYIPSRRILLAQLYVFLDI